MQKKINSFSALVYSTDPNANLGNQPEPDTITLPKHQQKLRIRLETKHRGGKAATLIAGFTGSQNDIDDLGKKLKTYCGTGGSVKDGEILVQGDNKEKIKTFLLKDGYKDVK